MGDIAAPTLSPTSRSAARDALRGVLSQLEKATSYGGHEALLMAFLSLRTRGPPVHDYGDALANNRLNRYSDVLPYNATRVHLKQGRTGDYINASHVEAAPGEQVGWKYIATQGPLDCTAGDLWQMVWEQGSTTVVMLTNLAEGRTNKCCDYVGMVQHLHKVKGAKGPVDSKGRPICSQATFGDFTVEIQGLTDELPGVAHRPLRLTHNPTGETRNVGHYHFYEWDDHGVPESTGSLLQLLRALRAAPQPGPPVVHCSAGIGRTGTLIAVDAATRKLQAVAQGVLPPAAAADAADLAALVGHLRQQRVGMVQTPEQFVFCHAAVRDELKALLRSLEDSQGS